MRAARGRRRQVYARDTHIAFQYGPPHSSHAFPVCAQVCGAVFAHVALPDGTVVHMSHRDRAFSAASGKSSGTDIPRLDAPATLADLRVPLSLPPLPPPPPPSGAEFSAALSGFELSFTAAPDDLQVPARMAICIPVCAPAVTSAYPVCAAAGGRLGRVLVEPGGPARRRRARARALWGAGWRGDARPRAPQRGHHRCRTARVRPPEVVLWQADHASGGALMVRTHLCDLHYCEVHATRVVPSKRVCSVAHQRMRGLGSFNEEKMSKRCFDSDWAACVRELRYA